MAIGLRIHTRVNRPDPDLIQRLAEFNSADLSDAMNMSRTMDPGLGPAYLPIGKVAGPAITISVPTGAQNVRKMGFEQSQPGDVIVINGFGALHYAMLGANIGRGLLHRGIAGMIIDGAFRDVSDFREMGLPMFSRGTCTLAGPKEGPGEVNVPISCGNIVVNPGDIIIADEDGIVAIPSPVAEEILDRVQKLTSGFEKIQDQLRRGEVTNIANIEQRLRDDGFQFVDQAY